MPVRTKPAPARDVSLSCSCRAPIDTPMHHTNAHGHRPAAFSLRSLLPEALGIASRCGARQLASRGHHESNGRHAQTFTDADSGQNQLGRPKRPCCQPPPSGSHGPVRMRYGFPSPINVVSHLWVRCHGRKSSKSSPAPHGTDRFAIPRFVDSRTPCRLRMIGWRLLGPPGIDRDRANLGRF